MIDLTKLNPELRKILSILVTDPMMGDVEILEDDYILEDFKLGIHTLISGRDEDRESHDEWIEGKVNPYDGGLTTETLYKISQLGYYVYFNDCPGCESEGMIVKNPS